MSLSQLLLAVWLILVGVTDLGWVTVSIKLIGGLALITGILWLVEGYHPITVYRRPQ